MRQQTIRYTAMGSVAIVIVVALAIMANWLASRHWERWDWTSSELYTLSEKTVNIISALEEDVKVVVFMTPATPLFEQVRELLNRYADLSQKMSVEFIDPDREPLKTQQLAEDFGISVADTVVFAVGERTKYVTSDQMAEYDYSGAQYGQPPTMRAFRGEEQFTAAILSLVAPDVPKVYFVGGHGEPSPMASGAINERGIAVLAEALKRENMETAEIMLFAGSIPEDADVLAILGPTEPYTEAEVTLLGEYLDSGGRLLVCLDPLIDASGVMRPIRLEAFLADYGVAVGDDLVVDPSRKLPFYDLSAVYLTDFVEHTVTKGLEGVAVLFLVTRSVQPAEGDGGSVRTVMETSAEGWGETDLGRLLLGEPIEQTDADTAGPVGVGVVAELDALETDDAPTGASRLAVFGDSDFLSDTEISNAGNLTLALNTFNWLATRDNAVGIPPREVERVSLYLTGQQLTTILLVSLLLMPGAAIVAGIVVWRRRRH